MNLACLVPLAEEHLLKKARVVPTNSAKAAVVVVDPRTTIDLKPPRQPKAHPSLLS